MWAVLAAALLAVVGCHQGEISSDDQTAKANALSRIAAQSPNADKVEQ